MDFTSEGPTKETNLSVMSQTAALAELGKSPASGVKGAFATVAFRHQPGASIAAATLRLLAEALTRSRRGL